VNTVLLNEDGVVQITDYCLNHVMKPEGNSRGMIDVGGFLGDCWMPTSDVRAFAEILLEISMGGSGIEGVSRPDVPGFSVEIIERVLSGDSRNTNSFVEIFEILKEDRSEIMAGIDCNEVLKSVNQAKCSEQSVQ
jgi:hypothetical protein